MECNFENCPNFERLGKKFADKISELEQENDRLKKEIKNNKSAYEVELGVYNMECGNLLEENKELAHYLACMTEQRNKANTILQEIKAIAECCMAKDACFECKYWDDCRIEDAEIPTYDICKLLMQKITKAEEE